MFQTSSPSYLFMAGMERCIRYMDGDGRNGMIRYEKRLERFMERMEGLQVLEVLDREICGKYRTVAGWDPSKIVVSTMRAEDFHGEELAETLRRKYHLEMEMTAPEYVIAMTSLMDTEEGFERLGTALLEIDGALRRRMESGRRKQLVRLQKAWNLNFRTRSGECSSARQWMLIRSAQRFRIRSERYLRSLCICIRRESRSSRRERSSRMRSWRRSWRTRQQDFLSRDRLIRMRT